MAKVNEHTIIIRCTTRDPIGTDAAVRRLDRALARAFREDEGFDRDFTSLSTASYTRAAAGSRRWGLSVRKLENVE